MNGTRLLLAIALLAVSCRYLRPDRNIGELVGPDAVVGEWVLTHETAVVLRKRGFSGCPPEGCRVVFARDRGCRFNSVIESVDGTELINGPCSWTLQHDTAGGSNVRRRNVVEIVLYRGSGEWHEYLGFARAADQLLLWQFLGDPDSWEFIEYARRSATTSNNRLQRAALRAAAEPER